MISSSVMLLPVRDRSEREEGRKWKDQKGREVEGRGKEEEGEMMKA